MKQWIQSTYKTLQGRERKLIMRCIKIILGFVFLGYIKENPYGVDALHAEAMGTDNCVLLR